MSSIFMLHYICFNIDKNALVLGNKRKTAVEILDKAKKIFIELPFFLRPGIYKWNEAEIVLDNGCRLMAEATTINSGISFTFHCVLADEFAHIAPNILDKFYTNLFPTITAGRARFMITSTQNGYNFIGSVVYGFTGGIGFLVAIVLFASIRERLVFADYPKSFEGFPIALVTAGLMALAFMGFSGLKIF